MTPPVPLPEAAFRNLVVALVVLAVVVFVGRVLLDVAWTLLKIAAVVLAALYVVSVLVPGLP